MNLHSVRFALNNVAIWLTAVGGNGRDIGTHLWAIEEGTPPTDPVERPTWSNRNYWTPPRLGWRAFDYRPLFINGYVQPICGHRSASRRPRVYTNNGQYGCRNCIAVAARSGIVALTYASAIDQSSAQQVIAAETRDWNDAGRPSPWPPSPSGT